MKLPNLTSAAVFSSRSSSAPRSSSSSDHASPTAQLPPRPEPRKSSTKKPVCPQEELCHRNSLLRTPKTTLPSQCPSNHLLKRNMSRVNRNNNTPRPRRCRIRSLCLRLSMSHNKLVVRLSCQRRGLSYLRKASRRCHLRISPLRICNKARATKLRLESGLQHVGKVD